MFLVCNQYIHIVFDPQSKYKSGIFRTLLQSKYTNNLETVIKVQIWETAKIKVQIRETVKIKVQIWETAKIKVQIWENVVKIKAQIWKTAKIKVQIRETVKIEVHLWDTDTASHPWQFQP